MIQDGQHDLHWLENVPEMDADEEDARTNNAADWLRDLINTKVRELRLGKLKAVDWGSHYSADRI